MPRTVNTEVYAARIKDTNVLMKSSSGGVFTAISNVFLSRGDAVATCIYNKESNRAEFRLLVSEEERDSARGSKYMYSFLGDIFDQCAQWLSAHPGKQILFVGVGCQAAGFCSYMEAKGLKERVVVVDMVCHGMPSPLIWDAFADDLQKNHGGAIESVSFRDKRNGWKQPTAVAEIGGKEVTIGGYLRLFYDARALRPSCLACPYATVERLTDMTIGDYWGIEEKLPEFYDPMGNSLVLVHTEVGQKLFEEIKESLDYCESNTRDCLQPNLQKPTEASPGREAFWKEYKEKGSAYIIRKYVYPSVARKIVNRLKNLINR